MAEMVSPKPKDDAGGYDYHFVKTPPEDLICAICQFPSQEPRLSECCGHTFCKSCLEANKKVSNSCQCPMCRSEEFVTISNKQADRKIRSLHVFCSNKELGCDWQGEVNDIIHHLGNCLFQLVCCSNNCGQSLQRQQLTSHVETNCPYRMTKCQYCHGVGEYQFIEGRHKKECPKFLVPCPNKCNVRSVQKDQVEKHIKICPLEIVQCEYYAIGCHAKITRNRHDIHKREMVEEHLTLCITELLATKTELALTKNRLVITEQRLLACEKKAKKSASRKEVINEPLQLKLTATERDLDITKQQLATTCHNLTKAEKEHTKLVASTDKALAQMETRITENEATTLKRVSELELRLTRLMNGIDTEVYWYSKLNQRASSVGRELPVIVKMSEFTKKTRNNATWLCEKLFWIGKCKLNMCVVTDESNGPEPNVLVHLNGEIVEHVSKSAFSKVSLPSIRVKLLNQITDSKHHNMQLLDSKQDEFMFTKVYCISYGALQAKSDTRQFYIDDTIFLELYNSAFLESFLSHN